MARLSTSVSFANLVELVKQVEVAPPSEIVDEGWLAPFEQVVLYRLAYLLDGPFLEIGAWVGKSTSVIAHAIRNSGGAKKFVTSELNPTAENFRPTGDGMGFFVPPESADCLGICSMRAWENRILPQISKPGGIIGELKRNLGRLGLADLVDIHEGDFSQAPRLDYRFIFNDCMHNPDEIDRGADALAALIGGRSVILAAHDWSEENEAALRRHLPISASTRADTLFFCEVSAR